jgi:ABC-type phosphate transport system substrate-binding protein
LVEEVGYVPLTSDESNASKFTGGCNGIGPAENTIDVESDSESGQLANCRDSREIVMLGSSTVSPVAIRLSAINRNTFLYMTGRSAGSSVGIQSFLAGAGTIGDASRALAGKDYEALGCPADDVDANGVALATCQGILPRGLLVGNDMLAVVINIGSTWADNLSFQQLVCLFDIADGMTQNPFGPEGELIENPNKTFQDCEIQDSFGSDAPDMEPSFFIPDIQSGTRDFFDETVIPVGITGFTSDDDIIDLIKETPNGVGFFGLAFAASAVDDIIVFSIDGLDPFNTLDQPNYPLSRPLFMYYDATIQGYKFEVYWHLCYMLSDFVQNEVEQVGYVKLSEDQVSQTKIDLGLAC